MTHEEFELIFCKNIRTRCAAQRLSSAALSSKSGVPLHLLRQIEDGILSDDFLVEHIFALARALGCHAYELCK